MNSLPIVVLAQGRQERLIDLPYPKHFVDVNGEPNIRRTLRILGELGSSCSLIVAPPKPEWNELCSSMKIPRTSFPGNLSIVKTVGAVLAGQREGALFLLGDVVFSRSSLRLIVNDNSPVAFFGKPGPNPWTKKSYDETYAFRCCGPLAPEIASASSHERPDIPWKLRDLRIQLRLMHVPIADWTDDIDTPDDLTVRLPLLQAFARADE